MPDSLIFFYSEFINSRADRKLSSCEDSCLDAFITKQSLSDIFNNKHVKSSQFCCKLRFREDKSGFIKIFTVCGFMSPNRAQLNVKTSQCLTFKALWRSCDVEGSKRDP